MPRKTLKQRAAEFGISIDILNNAKNQGVNVWNDGEMAAWVGNRRPKADSGKSGQISATDAEIASGDIPTGSIDEIKDALALATNYSLVKTLKEKLDAMLKIQKLEQESGKLISIEEVDERDVKIGSAIRAGILKLCNDTAPMVEGLDAAKAHAVLTEQGRAILDMLADGTSEFWKDQEEKRNQ